MEQAMIELIIPVLAALSMSAAPNASVTPSSAQAIARYMDYNAAFGFSGSVIVGDSTAVRFGNAYGEAIRETHVRNTAASVFSIGSLTKQFTAAAILRLAADGKITLDDSLDKFFPNVPADKAGITLYELLTHTSGLANYGPGSDYQVMPKADMLAYALSQRLLFKPGSDGAYSNMGYTLLAYVVEHVSGKSYEQYLHDQFFEPLGMKQTGYALPQVAPAHQTYSYADDLPFSEALFLPSMPSYGNVYGNGDIISTTGDLYAWIAALSTGRVLPPAQLAQLSKASVSGYATGWEVVQRDGKTVLSHGGLSDFGYNSLLQWYPDGSSILIVLCNVDQMPGGSAMRDAVSNVLWRYASTGIAPALPEVTFDRTARPAGLDGIYMVGTARLELRTRAGVTTATPLGQESVDLLGGFSGALKDRLDAETRQTQALLDRAVHGTCAADPGMSRACEGLSQRWRRLSATQRIDHIEYLGTVPSWWEPDGTDATFVQLISSPSILFRVHWRAGKVDSFGGHAISNPLETPLLPVTTGGLFGFNSGLANATFVKACGHRAVCVWHPGSSPHMIHQSEQRG
jgi:CubicO group peptidase (beta-lactamase class C family)